MEKPKYYITTPIYYPSDNLHIGHTYCTVAADAMARFKRLCGYDVMFLTGTDEHGLKIEKKARAAGITPKQYVDNVVSGIKDLWKLMNISNDDFIRTTDDRHVEVVQKIFKKLYDNGDIYKSEYEGWYCTPCESFWLDRQLVDGKCPDCGRPVQKTKEESYFFRLSKYADRLIEYINTHPDFIQPVSRRNEMLQNFLLPGLDDLCVSRTSFTWGIPVTFDDKHIVYVWVDALSNYISALGYLSEDDSKFKKFWPADLHLVGKEIIRFHTIIWPIMLMALDLPLPKQVFGHGWINFDGAKMSKSIGNVVDPVVLAERYGVDALRYFLLREMPLGSDANFSNELLIKRINSDLANDLGNLLSRTVAMIEKYFGGVVKGDLCPKDEDEEIKAMGKALHEKVTKSMDELKFSDALTDIWQYVGALNKYIDQTAPWVLAKDEANKDRLASVMYNLAEGLRIVGVLVTPFLPVTAGKMREQLGITDDAEYSWDSVLEYGKLSIGTLVKKGEAIFPRIDMEKEISYLNEILQKNMAAAEAKVKADEAKANETESKEEEAFPEISIDDFAKVKLVVGKVLTAEEIKKSKKLLKLTVDVGEAEPRTIAAGIKAYYTAEELVGKTVVVVANLKPAKLGGVMSEGMLLAAGEDDVVKLLRPEEDMKPGTSIH